MEPSFKWSCNNITWWNLEKIKSLKSKEFVLKAQIHAGGRGKAGGVKLIKDINQLETEAKKMMGKY